MCAYIVKCHSSQETKEETFIVRVEVGTLFTPFSFVHSCICGYVCKGGGFWQYVESKKNKVNLVSPQRKKIYISRREVSVNNSGSRSVAVGVKITKKKSVTNPEVTIRRRRRKRRRKKYKCASELLVFSVCNVLEIREKTLKGKIKRYQRAKEKK